MKISVYNYTKEMPKPLYYQAETFVRLTWADAPDYDMDDGLEEPAIHIALHHENTLFSYASIIQQEVLLGDIGFICYGVRSVFTFPASRGQGYATQIMQTCNRIFRQAADADVALLWTEKENIKLYQKAGWLGMHNMTTHFGEPQNPEIHNDETAMMLFLSHRAKQAQVSFKTGKLFVGEEPW